MRPNLTTLQALAVVTQFGFTLVVAVGLGIFVGGLIDQLLGTQILFTILGGIAGLASAAIGTVQLMYYIQRRTSAPPTDGRGE